MSTGIAPFSKPFLPRLRLLLGRLLITLHAAPPWPAEHVWLHHLAVLQVSMRVRVGQGCMCGHCSGAGAGHPLLTCQGPDGEA